MITLIGILNFCKIISVLFLSFEVTSPTLIFFFFNTAIVSIISL
jgi:hypothetical protein